MENKFSRNYFQLTKCFEGFDSEMVWSENFHFKPFPDSRAKREKERERERAFDFDFVDHCLWLQLCRSTNPLIYEPTDHAFDFVDLRTHELIFNPWTFDFAGDLEPSRHEPIFDPEPRTHEPISLSVWFWSTHEPLISDFFVVVVVVFWWFSCCVVVGFVWVVVENSIFRMLPNTWKYFLEQFS